MRGDSVRLEWSDRADEGGRPDRARARARARARNFLGLELTSSGLGGLQIGSLLLRPVDGAWLAVFRVVLGVVLGVSMVRFLVYGWVDRFFVAPRFHFKYFGFEWIEPLSSSGAMHGLFVALAGLAFFVAAGFCYRVSAALFALGLFYVQLIDVTTYLNHYYLAALLVLLLSFTPAHRMWSVDAWLRRRDAGDSTVAAGVLYLFRFQVGLVYVFAGLAKLQSDWLVHAQPLRIWLGASVGLPLVGPLLALPWLPLAMSWAGFAFDSTIVAWLLWSRTRPFAYAVVIAFHVMTRALFPIGMFPAIMIASALVFFSPSWPRSVPAVARRMFSRRRVVHEAPASIAPALDPRTPGESARRTLLVALGLAYCALQLALPLRSYAYGGNVLWHEQGMRFSWRVMVRAKGGSTTFVVHDRSNGRTFHVSPREYLTDLQESEMSSQPDLILQLAHHIRRDLESRGLGPLEVRAEARASLNGRPSAILIDPSVDLTQVADGLSRADWIMPAPMTAPPHTRPVP
jgi:vitamin K-dependent gamma-carboxylase